MKKIIIALSSLLLCASNATKAETIHCGLYQHQLQITALGCKCPKSTVNDCTVNINITEDGTVTITLSQAAILSPIEVENTTGLTSNAQAIADAVVAQLENDEEIPFKQP